MHASPATLEMKRFAAAAICSGDVPVGLGGGCTTHDLRVASVDVEAENLDPGSRIVTEKEVGAGHRRREKGVD